jgi:hypothetical protein
MTLQDVYQQASGSGCGVDPAIIAAIMSTETDTSKRPLTLGITTAAPSGAGSSGQTVGTSTPGAVAAGQPGAFWGYNDGAEAACAFANYIRGSGLYGYAVGDLGNAQKFFQDLIDNNANYYVPMAGGESKAAYYAHWQQVAQSFGGAAVGVTPGGRLSLPVPVLVAAAAAAMLLLLD